MQQAKYSSIKKKKRVWHTQVMPEWSHGSMRPLEKRENMVVKTEEGSAYVLW